MRALILSCLIAAMVCYASCTDRLYWTRYQGDKVFRITPTTQYQLERLTALKPYAVSRGAIDFWTYPSVIGQPIDVHVRTSAVTAFQTFLNANKFTFTIHIDDLQKTINKVELLNRHLQSLRANGSIVGTFASHADINSWLSQQCANYSSIATCGSWGLSYEGRDMRYIKLGKPSSQPKKVVYIISGMHAREWLGPATIVWIVNKMVSTYGNDSTVQQLLNTYDWIIEPVVNPDGYEYSRNSERLWRKTRSNNGDPNCIGVDGNRNFDFHWDGEGDQCDDTYPGPQAFSEKETQNIRKFIMKQDASNGLAFFSVHTYSKVWLLPYGYAENTYPTDYDELLRAGTVGLKALEAVNRQSWQIGNIVDLLYVAAGNSADWFKGNPYAVYSYALELRGDSFIVPASDIDPSGAEVFAGFAAAVQAMKK